MQAPKTPADEFTRNASLRALNILDTAVEERFDRLTRLASRVFDVPIALVSLVDANRQWFKSCVGLDTTGTARDISFCGHAILGEGAFVISDAALDSRFHDNPLVTGEPYVRFYAGYPLRIGGAAGSSAIGTLCLIDSEPRDFSDDQIDTLRDLARMAEQELSAVRLATTDELTGLSNRRGFESLAVHALSLCRRLDTPTAMLMMDLDGFKEINDNHGHAEGDIALKSFSELLTQAFRDSDVVGRIGGDEFAVLLTNLADGTLGTVLNRLNKGVERHNRTAHRGYAIRFSVGSVKFDPKRHHGVSELLAEADRLMYAQKQHAKAERV